MWLLLPHAHTPTSSNRLLTLQPQNLSKFFKVKKRKEKKGNCICKKMENLMLPCMSVTKPPVIIPQKRDSLSEFSPKTSKSTLFFTKKRDPRFPDSHLNYLCRNGRLTEAVTLLDSVAKQGSKVRPKTYINLIETCIDSNSIHLGRKLHACIDLVAETDVFVKTKLVSMYAKCGCFNDARKAFDEMHERNLYTWSAMIGACSREQRWREAVELFLLMMEEGVLPDDFLFPKILQACGNCGDFQTGKLLHCLVIKLGMSRFTRIRNSILAVYVKCEELSWARRFFKSMAERDVVAWNSMISGYCQIGENEEAHRLFDEMCKEGVEPGLVTWNILISSYHQLRECDRAMELMRKMESLGISPDVFTWTCMVSGFSQNGRTSQALDLFKEMFVVGVKPNGVTITSAISACTELEALETGLEIHAVAIKMGFTDDVLVGNSTIDMYSKCGELEAAERVFDIIKAKDVYSWNSMIGGYCQAGYCGKAYELFKKMQESDVLPNVITWNIMISGYIHNGDEDEALDLFQRMEKDGNVKRNTASWNSLIAGYQQLGQKNSALGIFRKMQALSVSPNYVTILSVLPACANLVAEKKVKEIQGCVFRRSLESSLPVMNSLINTYAKSGNIVYSRTIFDGMPSKDIITWNSMISGYVFHGCADAALDLFYQIRNYGLEPNRGTFLSIILAHSLAGMVNEGKQLFSSITEGYQIMPMIEHYSSMIDLYGRSGRLVEALEFIEDMPIKPDSSVWEALLTACRIHGNIGLTVRAMEHLLELEPGNRLIHQLILQTYAIYGIPDALKVRKLEKENMVRKSLGQSWIEAKNIVYTFVTGGWSKTYLNLLYPWLQCMQENVKAYSHSRFCIEEEEKEEISGIHSEKLALAFALVGSYHSPQIIRIVKNIRMCANCHETAKYVSMTYGREIFLNDSKCLHHFQNGHCSCDDYW